MVENPSSLNNTILLPWITILLPSLNSIFPNTIKIQTICVIYSLWTNSTFTIKGTNYRFKLSPTIPQISALICHRNMKQIIISFIYPCRCFVKKDRFSWVFDNTNSQAAGVFIDLAALPILMHKIQQCQTLQTTLLTFIYYVYILVYCIYWLVFIYCIYCQ